MVASVGVRVGDASRILTAATAASSMISSAINLCDCWTSFMAALIIDSLIQGLVEKFFLLCSVVAARVGGREDC